VVIGLIVLSKLVLKIIIAVSLIHTTYSSLQHALSLLSLLCLH
jgi:hypothetical protein